MKQHFRSGLVLTVLSTSLSLGLCADSAQPGSVDFGKFTESASGAEFVEVNVNGSMIAMAARLAQKDQPEIADLLHGLKGVRVNVFGLDDQNRADVEKRVKDLRAELDAKGWQRVVAVQQKHEDIGVYMKTQGEESVQGLVVTILDGHRQAVLINIVGDIRPEKVALIGERFNIEPLKKLKGMGKCEPKAEQ